MLTDGPNVSNTTCLQPILILVFCRNPHLRIYHDLRDFARGGGTPTCTKRERFCYKRPVWMDGKSALYDQLTHVNRLSANKQPLVGRLLVVSRSSVGRSSIDCCPLVGRQSVINWLLVGQQFPHHGWSTCRLTNTQLTVKCWQSVGEVSAVSRPTVCSSLLDKW